MERRDLLKVLICAVASAPILITILSQAFAGKPEKLFQYFDGEKTVSFSYSELLAKLRALAEEIAFDTLTGNKHLKATDAVYLYAIWDIFGLKVLKNWDSHATYWIGDCGEIPHKFLLPRKASEVVERFFTDCAEELDQMPTEMLDKFIREGQQEIRI